MGPARFDEILARFHLGDVSIELPNIEHGGTQKAATLQDYEAGCSLAASCSR